MGGRWSSWLGGGLLAALAVAGLPRSGRADKPPPLVLLKARFVAPELVERGWPFEATILRKTEQGEVPLAPGTRVRYREREILVGEGGLVELPPVETDGNHFLDESISLPAENVGLDLDPHHVESVHVGPDVEPRIAFTSSILRPGGTITTLGQRLDRLARQVSLQEAGGKRLALGPPVFRSSLSVRHPLPPDLPEGRWRVVMNDGRGRLFVSPTEARVPRVRVWGGDVRDLTRSGVLNVEANADVTVELSGGLPHLRLERTRIELTAGRSVQVPYQPLEAGRFKVEARVLTPFDDPPPPHAPGVDAEVLAPHAHYDALERSTHVRAPARLLDLHGEPLEGRVVAMLVSHAKGVEYGRLTTDAHGIATLDVTLPGHVTPDGLHHHLWAARGSVWRKPPPVTCTCELAKPAVVTQGKDRPDMRYTVGDKADSLRFSLVITGKLKAQGTGTVTLDAKLKPTLVVFQGTYEDVHMYMEGLREAAKAQAGGNPGLAKELRAKAEKIGAGIKAGSVTLAMEKPAKEVQPERFKCNRPAKEEDWRLEPTGVVSWEAKEHRAGTAAEPKSHNLYLEVEVEVTCGGASQTVSLCWTADVAWENKAVVLRREALGCESD